MTPEHDQLKEATDIALEAQAIADTLSEALDRLAETSGNDRDQLHRLSQIAKALSRLLNDIASEIVDVMPEIEGLRKGRVQ
ncbi:hypothetical protein ACU8MX_18295 [Rhizobium leguminosarum]